MSIDTKKLTDSDRGKRVLFTDSAGEESEGRILSWELGRIKVLCRDHVREFHGDFVALESGRYAGDE